MVYKKSDSDFEAMQMRLNLFSNLIWVHAGFYDSIVYGWTMQFIKDFLQKDNHQAEGST